MIHDLLAEPRTGGPPGEGLISVIVTTYNRKELLRECLNSIVAQDYPHVEVIVVDDNSRDGTAALVEREYPAVQVIRNRLNRGVAFSRNAAVLRSHGEYLQFLDDDAVLLSREHLRRAVSTLALDPKISQVGGSLTNIARFRSDVNGINGYDIASDFRTVPVFLPPEAGGSIKECQYVPGNNCFMRKALFVRAGGLDLGIGYPFDDTDLGLRLSRLGYRAVITWETAAFHKKSRVARRESKLRYAQLRLRCIIKSHGLWEGCAFSAGQLLRGLSALTETRRHAVAGGVGSPFVSNIASVRDPWLPLVAFAWNLAHLRQTLRSRGQSFLAAVEGPPPCASST